jgi:hypothetical protein
LALLICKKKKPKIQMMLNISSITCISTRQNQTCREKRKSLSPNMVFFLNSLSFLLLFFLFCYGLSPLHAECQCELATVPGAGQL